MKKVLIYENRKTDGPMIWDASTKKLEEKAFKKLFNVLRKDWECYDELEDKVWNQSVKSYHDALKRADKYKSIGEDVPREITIEINFFKEKQDQKILFDKAKRDDASAIKDLLTLRQDYEYEDWILRELEE